mgnify:CR=1 FL=1
MFLMLVLATVVAVHPLTAQNGVDRNPFCNSNTFKGLNADVYIVLPDDIRGQLISGQFMRVAKQFDCPRVAMTPDEVIEFIHSDGFNLLKDGGNVYFVVMQNKRYALWELIKLGDAYQLSKSLSYDEQVVEKTAQPFLQLIIPRPQKRST